MRTMALMIVAALLTTGCEKHRSVSQPPRGLVATPNQTPVSTAEGQTRLTGKQLEELLSPIALYPDSLLAQVLPAATYPSDIALAGKWLDKNPKPQDEAAMRAWEDAIDRQNWEPSVKAIAYFPEVLRMLIDNPNWTEALGKAFLDQQKDVMATVQCLRRNAQDAGNLQTTPQQQVVSDDTCIEILPADPEVIYVPVYDTQYVYVSNPEPHPIVFRVEYRFRIGTWMDNACDWKRRCVTVVGKGRWNAGWTFDDRQHKWKRDEPLNNRPTARPGTNTNNGNRSRGVDGLMKLIEDSIIGVWMAPNVQDAGNGTRSSRS